VNDDGWTKSYRRKWKHPVFLNFRDASIWAFLLDNAAWRDNTDVRFENARLNIMRGQIAVSERYLATGFCCDRQVIRRVLDALQTDHMITREKTSAATIITICNYELYQSLDQDEKPTEPTQETQREPTLNPPVNPNSEEDNNSKNYNTGVGVDVRARLRVVGERVMEIMGVRDDPRWFGDCSMVEVWLKCGFDPELDIYPTVEKLMAQRSQGPPSSLKYFDRAIAQTYADRNRSIPEPSNANGTRKTAPADRLSEQLRAIGAGHLDGPRPLEPFGDFAGGDIIDQPARSH